MPIFQFKCLDCSRVFEAIQKHSDLPLSTCIICQGPLEKLFSVPAPAKLVGKGFYKNDYPKGKK